MKQLQETILREGRVLSDRVVKVDSFLNHQVDPALIAQIGERFAELFREQGVTRILTVEASGIHIAYATALAMQVPMVYAKKKRAVTQSEEVYQADVFSYTRNETVAITVSKSYLHQEDRVLIIDDILANGAAMLGLVDIIEASGAQIVGAGVVIEKRFQSGRRLLEERGISVVPLASIESMQDGIIRFA